MDRSGRACCHPDEMETDESKKSLNAAAPFLRLLVLFQSLKKASSPSAFTYQSVLDYHCVNENRR